MSITTNDYDNLWLPKHFAPSTCSFAIGSARGTATLTAYEFGRDQGQTLEKLQGFSHRCARKTFAANLEFIWKKSEGFSSSH